MPTTRAARNEIIVFGLMFDLPYAGIVAQFLHYLYGLRSLGWDVWYVEDSLSWPYDPAARTEAADPAASVRRVASVLAAHGFGDRWIYRCAIPERACFGAGEAELRRLYRQVDLALNVTGAQEIRDEHETIPAIVYVQSDPFGLQVDIANGNAWAREQLERHSSHFTFGELVGTPGSATPTGGFEWLPTRQPVALELWPVRDPGRAFTTVTSWRNDTKHKEWEGERYYWSKDREFLTVIDLPRHVDVILELAIDGVPNELAELRRYGWTVHDRPDLAADLEAYHHYISHSRAEFTVARDQVARPRTGWFSDRSACYLAAGHPVVTQDTGFGEVLPVGAGLFAFASVTGAAAAIEEIEADLERHSSTARTIAEDCFAATTVIASLLDRAS